MVSAGSPLRTLDDLVRKYKENPGLVSWGGFAPGSPDHILSGLVVTCAFRSEPTLDSEVLDAFSSLPVPGNVWRLLRRLGSWGELVLGGEWARLI